MQEMASRDRTDDEVIFSRKSPWSVLPHFSEKVTIKAENRPPGKPTGVTVAPYQTGRNARLTLNISWTANPNGNKAITNHEIDWSPDGTAGSWEDLRTVSGQLTNTLFTGLSPGTTRHIRIRSQDSDGWGPWSDVVSGTTNAVSAPGRPTGLTTTVSSSTIGLSWTAGDDGGSPITGYSVEGFKDGDQTFTVVISATLKPDVTSYTATGLTASTRYNIQVRARNSEGIGRFAAGAQVTTEAATTPGRPTGLTTTVSPSTINLSWMPPVETGGSPITGYSVEGFKDGDQTFTVVISATLKPDVTSYTATGLTASTRYNIQVRARNSEGIGRFAAAAQATTAALTAPAAPTGLTATADGPTKINLSWTAPTNTGGAAITGYKIESRTGTLGDWADLVTDTKSTATTYSHTGLTPSTPWFYRVSAINSEGAGTASSVATATTDAATRPSAPRNLTATPSDRSTIILNWMPPADDGGSPITFYRVGVSTDQGSSWGVLADVRGATTYSHTGLSAGTRRDYRVVAANSSGRGFSDRSNVATATTAAATAPGAPTGLTATAEGQTVINLSWTVPADNGGKAIMGYRVQWSSNGNAPWTDVTPAHTGTGRTYRHTRLSAGTTRHYRVFARNSVGESTSASAVATATTEAAPTLSAPAAPTRLRAEAEGPETISLSWNAPTNTGGADITGYQIEVSPNGTSNWGDLVANTGSTTTGYVHRGLDAGTTRHYRVYAINSQGAGAVSNVANATTLPATVPKAPTELTATHDGQTTINLGWKAPTNTGGVPLTGYQMEVSPNGTDTWTEVTPAHAGTGRTYSHTGLTAGTTRYYRVYARNSKGLSAAASNVANATTTAAATAPGAPPNLQVFSPGFHDVRLTWGRPPSDSPITGYKVEWSTDGGTNWEALIGYGDLTRTRYQFLSSRLTPGSVFHFRVLARSASGDSAPSDAVSVTAASAPGSGIATNVRVRQTSANAAQISWDAPTDLPSGHQMFGYNVYKSDDDGDFWSQFARDVTTTTYTDDQVSAGKTYGYRVTTWIGPSENEALQGQFSDAAFLTITIARAPDAPTSLTAVANGQTTINLNWTVPSNTGGAAITGYRVEVSPTGTGDTWTDLEGNTNSTATTYSHTGLSAGTTRHYRVRALNSVGAGAASNVATATTTALTATAPGAPTGLTATASGQTTINLSWTAPSNTGGAAITGYRVEVSPNGTDNWTDLVANSAATTYAHTGLSAGVTRHYRVRAINAVGTGAASNVATATTTALTAPGAPTGLTATAAGRTIINLSWTAPTESGGAAITGYRVEVSPTGTGDTWADLVANSTTTTYAHTGLSANTTRYYRVRALNAVGASDASNTANATTDGITAPSAPTGLTATASGQTIINLRWAAPADNGGAAVTGYQVEGSEDAGSTWMDLVANTAATTYSHTGLPPETTRQYRVRAINAVGTGAASNVVRATTEAATVLSLAGAISSQRYPVDLAIAALVLPTAIGGTPPYMYALSPETLPEGLSLEDGTLGGTPTAVTASQGFTWTVTDALGAESTMEFTLEIYEITFVTTVMNQSYDRGQGIDPLILPEVTGGTDPVQYTLNLLWLPSGLRFDASTRTIAGTPVQITSPVELTYRATDAKGAQASLTFTLEVVSPVATEEQKEPPQELIVHANYPNPFHTSTNLLFDLPWPAEIKLDVLDLTGRRVYTHPMVRMAAGREQVITLEQVALPAGVYLYRMVATSMEHGASAVKIGHLMRMR